MATSKKILAEQASRIYARYVDRENLRPVANIEEMILLVGQAINEVAKVSVLPKGKFGGLEIEDTYLLQFEEITVETDSRGAYITLPTLPLSLPDDMGIQEIVRSDQFMTAEQYIPLPSNLFRQIKSTIVESLEQNIGYFRKGFQIRFTKNITLSSNGSVSEVDVTIIGSDLNQFTENQSLPISPEVERKIILAVLESLGAGVFARAELSSKNNLEDGN